MAASRVCPVYKNIRLTTGETPGGNRNEPMPCR